MNPTAFSVLFAITKFAGFNVNDVEQFLGGFIKGTIDEDDLTKIQACLVNAESLEAELEKAVADFEKGDITDIIAGVEVIGQMLSELPADLATCKDMQGDLDRIESWAAIFKDPKALAKVLMANVLPNISQIEQDVIKTKNDITTAELFYAGEDVADLLILALGPVPASPDTIQITQW